jgi:hypothetical protein
MSLKIDLDSVIITGAYSRFSRPFIPRATDVATDCVIKFEKFFPYANGNGDPIYDENDGSELRDPETGREK